DWGTAWAINDRSEVVGEVDGGGSLSLTPVSWQGGTVEPLATSGAASAINNRGQIVGLTWSGPNVAVPVTWRNLELTGMTSRHQQMSGRASAINEHAVIVGLTDIVTPNPSLGLGTAATLWQEGALVNLNDVLVCGWLPDPLFLSSAPDINERGQI